MLKFLLLAVPLWAQQQSRYELPAEQRTGAIKQIWVVCHSHLDIGFTRPPDEVARDYKDNIDTAIRLARENGDFRWTIESTWMLEHWLERTGDQALIDELGKLMRVGRISLGGGFANMHSGLMAPEESNRLIYLAQKFRNRFGIEAAVAYQNDVPGFTWAYPRVLAGSGVKYLVTGLNLFIGGGNNLGVGRDPFYWVGPDGSRVLTWFTYDSYVEGYRWHLRGERQLEELEASVPRRLAWLEQNGYKYDTYFLMASPGDNASPTGAMRILERIRAWNTKHSELPMKMVTAEEFFAYVTRKYGDSFSAASGDAAGHWETVKLKVPEVASRMRQAANELPAVEMASTLAHLLKGSSFPGYDLAAAWHSLLVFHEHTADAGPGWPGYFSRQDTDWSNVAHYAAAMTGFSNSEQLFRKALEHLGPGPGTNTLLVFNGLSWQRGGLVRVENVAAELRDGPLTIIDLAAGKPVPYEDVPGTHRQIVFFAHDVPAVGYRMYSIAKGTSAAARGEFSVDVKCDETGKLTSIVDRTSGREFLPRDSARPFGSLFVGRGRRGFQPVDTVPAEVNSVDGPVQNRLEIARKGSALPLTVVTTYPGEHYADLRFDVDLGFYSSAPENQQFAIALPLSKGQQMFVDGAGFVIRIPEDLLPGGGAPRYTPVHFTHVQQASDWGVTLANQDSAFVTPDLLFPVANESRMAQTRESGTQKLFRTEPRGSPVQSFRFRIAAQPEQAWEWERMGAELNLPLRAVFTQPASDPPARGFFELNRPEVQLLAFKPAESGGGRYILRFQEISGREVRGIKLVTALRFSDATIASTVEEPHMQSVDLSNFSLRPWETLTVLVRQAN
jgi:hypothetical protein